MLGANEAAPYAAAVGGVAAAFVVAWNQRRQAREAAKPGAQEALNEGYGALVADMRAELNVWKAEVVSLRAEVHECEVRHEQCERKHDEALVRIAHLEQLVERRKIDRGPGEGPERRSKS